MRRCLPVELYFDDVWRKELSFDDVVLHVPGAYTHDLVDHVNNTREDEEQPEPTCLVNNIYYTYNTMHLYRSVYGTYQTPNIVEF